MNVFAFLVKTPFYDDIINGVYSGGLYNGYVGFSGYLPESYQSGYHGYLDDLIDVHGGITFDRILDFSVPWASERIPILDYEIPTEGSYRVIGFDTLHINDDQYEWDFEKVENETEYLLNQVEKLIILNEIRKLQCIIYEDNN